MRRGLFSVFAVLTLCLIAGAARAQFPAFLQKGLVVSVAGQIETGNSGTQHMTPFTATITVTNVSGNTVSGTVTSTPAGVFSNATTWSCVANQYCAALSNRATTANGVVSGTGASGQFWLNPANPTGSIFGPDGETYTPAASCSGGTSCLAYASASGSCTLTDQTQSITTIALAYGSSTGMVNSYSFCQGADNSATSKEPSTILTSYTFTYPPNTLTVANSGNGTVTSSPSGINCGSTCSASFPGGSTVTLTATPASGFSFAGWGGACSGTGSCSVTMNTAQSVSASFVPGMATSYALTVNASGSGTVTSSPAGINCGSTCSASYQSGTVVSLTQTANSGFAFAGWGGACSGVGTCIVTMSAAQSVSASFAAGSPPASPLVAAVLPASRSATVGGTVTAFATMINTGAAMAPGCAISPIGGAPLNFTYQTTNPTTNALSGTANTPVNIPGNNGVQTFVIAVSPTAAFAPMQLPFSFACGNVAPAPSLTGLNTLLVSASTTPVPDIVALAGTASNDGILHVSGPSGAGAFVVATVNVGAGGAITATANTGSATLPLPLTLCETNPATGACITPVDASAAVTINSNDTPTFAIFGQASGAIPFDPANSRIFVQFADSSGNVRGETSVAVETQ
jgi:hypothetical protein